MNNKCNQIFVFLLLFAVTNAKSIELNQDADSELVNELIQLCTEDSKEDKVKQTELLNYVVECVNDELRLEGKQVRKQKDLLEAIKKSGLLDITAPK